MVIITEHSTRLCGTEPEARIYRPRKLNDMALYTNILEFAMHHYTNISALLENANAVAPFAERTFLGGGKSYIAPYPKEVEDFVYTIMTITTEAAAFPRISRSMYYVANCDNADAPLEAHLVINKLCTKRDNLWDLIKCCLATLQTLAG